MAPLFLLSLAAAAEPPALWYRQGLTVSAFPLGALSETRLQARIDGHRSDSIVFQSTYYGAGVRLDVSPAFVNPGVTLSLAPIDVFDVDLSAEMLGYLPGTFGLLPYEGLGSKLESVRDARTDHVAALGWALDANPTLKLQVGPIIVLDLFAVSWLHITPPEGETAPLVYEPLRDMLVAWDDVYLENQPVVLYEVVHGKQGPMFAFGATWRDRFALVSQDRSAGLGAMVIARPEETPGWPTFVLLVTEALIDQDRVGKEPFIALQANWIGEHRRAKPSPPEAAAPPERP